MNVELGPGVAELLWRLGEAAIFEAAEALTGSVQYESLRI